MPPYPLQVFCIHLLAWYQDESQNKYQVYLKNGLEAARMDLRLQEWTWGCRNGLKAARITLWASSFSSSSCTRVTSDTQLKVILPPLHMWSELLNCTFQEFGNCVFLLAKPAIELWWISIHIYFAYSIVKGSPKAQFRRKQPKFCFWWEPLKLKLVTSLFVGALIASCLLPQIRNPNNNNKVIIWLCK